MIAEHTDKKVAKAMDCTNEAATKDMRFDQDAQIRKHRVPS